MTLQALMLLQERMQRGPAEVPSLPRLTSCSPEAQGCVAQILLAQHLRGDVVDVPEWRAVSGLCTEVVLAFLQLELAVSPTTFGAPNVALEEEVLLRTQAADVRVADVLDVVELCFARAHRDDRFPPKILALLDQQANRVDPRSLLNHYERLLDWSVAPIAVERLRSLGARVPAYTVLQGRHRSLAAVRAHGVQGDRVLLLRLAAEVEVQEDLRAMAVTALGDCARRQDLEALLEICLRRPEQLASAGLAALVALRHRGIFLQAAHLVGVFELALHARCPLEALTCHLVTERRELLMGVAADDVRLAVWLLAFDRPEHGLSAVLVRLLDSSGFAIRTSALALLAQPDPCEQAVRLAAEEAVLGLREHAVARRRALQVIGGERTIAVLLEALDNGGLEEPWLPVLIGLLPDGDPRLDDLEASLPARCAGAERLWHVPRGRGRSMVRLAPKMGPQRLFVRLCATGSLTVVADLLRLLRDRTASLAEPADEWSPAASTRPVLSVACIEALEHLAKAVSRRGGLEPLIGHPLPSERPAAFVRWMLVRALEDLEDPSQRALCVRSLPLDGLAASRLIAWGRTDDPELRRDVLERMGDHDDVVALGAYVVQAMDDPDARVARAGARAAIRMRCPAAVLPLLALLERPRMELKRVAARGLGVLGDGRAVRPLVGWLGRHDNQGFRAEVLEALQTVVPHGVRGVLVGELREATGRTATLLAAAVASLDEPGRGHGGAAVEDATLAEGVPFLFRAQTFAGDPTGATLDALLSPSFGPLSADAERVLVGLVDRVFSVLAGPVPDDRSARELRGRAAGNFLRWWTTQRVERVDRETRLQQLRVLPTLPMGSARWVGLVHADAMLTVDDLKTALDDCTFTARRDASMREILADTGLDDGVVRDLVAADSTERAALLARVFTSRPVLGWTPVVEASWPAQEVVVDAVTAVSRALEADETVPDDWPWAPTCWDAVLRVGGERRPAAHTGLLRALFVDALADLPPTSDRVRWLCTWADRPPAVDTWAGWGTGSTPARVGRVDGQTAVRSLDDVLPEVTAVAVRSATTLQAVLEWLATPGEERRGLRALERFPGPSAASVVRPLLERRSLRAPALRCFRRVASPTEVCEVLCGMLNDRDDEWVRSCARTLGFMREPESVRSLVGLLDHRSAAVRRVACQALKLQPDAASSVIRRSLRRARPDRRAALREVLDELTAAQE